eukprot:2273988-Rhodomonas_salina.1
MLPGTRVLRGVVPRAVEDNTISINTVPDSTIQYPAYKESRGYEGTPVSRTTRGREHASSVADGGWVRRSEEF